MAHHPHGDGPAAGGADLIEERKEDFARELSLEQGKPFTAEAIADKLNGTNAGENSG